MVIKIEVDMAKIKSIDPITVAHQLIIKAADELHQEYGPWPAAAFVRSSPHLVGYWQTSADGACRVTTHDSE